MGLHKNSKIQINISGCSSTGADLKDIYNTDVSKDLISTVTDGVLEEVTSWQNRTLDSVYPIMYLDCIHVKGRDNNLVINKAVYLAIGVNQEGKKELLGIWNFDTVLKI